MTVSRSFSKFVTQAELDTALSSFTPASSNGTKTLFRWTPLDNYPPSANYATFNTLNAIAVLDFDATANESAIFMGVVPEGAVLTGGFSVNFKWCGFATGGNTVWLSEFERTTGNLNTNYFASGVSTVSTVALTGGYTTSVTINHNAGEIAGIQAGDLIRFKLSRSGSLAADTMTGDAQLVFVEIRHR